MIGNNVGKGAVFDFEMMVPTEGVSEDVCKDQPNINVKNCTFEDNTSGTSASIFQFEDLPWLWIRFEEKTNLNNNFGLITNEIYARRFR
jgi:hypothetical protein